MRTLIIAVAIGTSCVTASAQERDPAASLPAGSSFRDCAGCPEMIVLPTELGRIAIGKYEITTEEWAACVAAAACGPPRSMLGSDTLGRLPQGGISATESARYVEWLTDNTGRRYRLPTGSEWQAAARVGYRGPWRNGDANVCSFANGQDQAFERSAGPGLFGFAARCDDAFAQFAPVGSYPANSLGLHEMIGNVSEWTMEIGVRGGDYIHLPSQLSPEYFEDYSGWPDVIMPHHGLRVVREINN